MNATAMKDVARYAAEVRAALAELPADQRMELLEDLTDHLREVSAELEAESGLEREAALAAADAGSTLSLAERLGPPEAYADELRAAAGLPPRREGGSGRHAAPRVELVRSELARRLRQAWAAAAWSPAGRTVRDFLPGLRPAWWVLRGYLTVLLVAALLQRTLHGGNTASFPVPVLFGSAALGLLSIAVAVIASVALGKPGAASASAAGRWLTVLGNAGLGVFALVLLVSLQGNGATAFGRQAGAVATSGSGFGLRMNGREVSNIFAFDAKGRPLKAVYLVDQDGRPLVATHTDSDNLEVTMPVDPNGMEVGNLYPQAQSVIDVSSGYRHQVPVPGFAAPAHVSTVSMDLASLTATAPSTATTKTTTKPTTTKPATTPSSR